MLKRLLSQSVVYAAIPQLPRLITIFTYPVLTRHLTATDYGVYGVIIAYTGIISLLKDMGLGMIFFNSYYKHPVRFSFIWRHLHGFLTYWSMAYSVILFIILYFSIPDVALHYRWFILFLTVVPVLFFENTQTICSYYFRVKERPLPVTVISAISGVVGLVLTVAAVVYWKVGYMGWLIGSFGASLFMFICMGYYLYFRNNLRPILSIRPRFLRKYFRLGIPMIFHNYSGYLLNTSDRLVMDWVKVDIKQIGLYNIAYTFGGLFSILETAIGMAAGPIFLKYHTERKYEDERRLTFICLIIMLSLSFLTCLWLKEIFILLVKNESLQSAYTIGIIIIMGYNYKPMFQAASNILFFYEKPVALLKISFTAGMLNVLLNLFLIPRYGIMAAAYTTLFCLLFMGFSGFYMKEYKAHKKVEYYPLAWLAAILTITFLSLVVKDIHVYGKGVITISVFTGLLLLLLKNKNKLSEN